VDALHVTVKCRNLPSMDHLSLLMPMVGLFKRSSLTSQYHLVDQTEVQRDNNNPNFEREFTLQHTIGENQVCTCYLKAIHMLFGCYMHVFV
jgi:hypothetical protein